MIAAERPPVWLLAAALELVNDLKQRFRKSPGIGSLQAAAKVEETLRIELTYVRPLNHRGPVNWLERVPREWPVNKYRVPVQVRERPAAP